MNKNTRTDYGSFICCINTQDKLNKSDYIKNYPEKKEGGKGVFQSSEFDAHNFATVSLACSSSTPLQNPIKVFFYSKAFMAEYFSAYLTHDCHIVLFFTKMEYTKVMNIIFPE